jgi:hypothetical protein
MRTGNRARRAAIVIVATALVGCRALTPSGFWKGYRSNTIVKQFSDQGPWGGERWILWDSPSGEPFSETDARRFAERHGWQFLDRVEVSPESIGGSPLFRVGYDRAREGFPKLISGDSLVLKFDSRWAREEPGTNDMSTAYGYVQISKDGRRMVVYHLWGNS